MSWAAHRYHDISCGHRVYGHESKCAHLHGHNYRVHFTVVADPRAEQLDPQRAPVLVGELDSIGRVMDFSVIKSKLCMWLENVWDHKFLVWEQDPAAKALAEIDPAGVVVTPFNPTAENMAAFLVETVGPHVLHGTGCRLTEVRIDETRKCSASYLAGER